MGTPNYQTFVLQFQEFASAGIGFVNQWMTNAQLEIDSQLWGAYFEQGVYYLTAHKIAMTPFGNTAKLVNKDGTTVYEKPLNSLMLQVTGGVRTVAQLAPQPNEVGPTIQILSATNASPIVLQVSTTAQLFSGQIVSVQNVTGLTSANGTWAITIVDATHVSLNGSVGNGAYVSGGTLTPQF